MNAHPVTGAAVFFLFAAISAMLAFTSSIALVQTLKKQKSGVASSR
jgi:hypothetical protein